MIPRVGNTSKKIERAGPRRGQGPTTGSRRVPSAREQQAPPPDRPAHRRGDERRWPGYSPCVPGIGPSPSAVAHEALQSGGISVTFFVMKARTGAAGYFERRLQDPSYSEAHRQATAKVSHIDEAVRAVISARAEHEISKAHESD